MSRKLPSFLPRDTPSYGDARTHLNSLFCEIWSNLFEKPVKLILSGMNYQSVMAHFSAYPNKYGHKRDMEGAEMALRWHSEARMMEGRFTDDTCITEVLSWSNCSGIVEAVWDQCTQIFMMLLWSPCDDVSDGTVMTRGWHCDGKALSILMGNFWDVTLMVKW